MAVGEEQIPFKPMEFVRPAKEIIGPELDDASVARPVIGNIPVAREDRIRSREVGIRADKVAQVFILKGGEIRGRGTSIHGAEEDLGRNQFI